MSRKTNAMELNRIKTNRFESIVLHAY